MVSPPLQASPAPCCNIVAVVDDDERVLEALEDLLCSTGHVVHGFSSAEDLLRSDNFGLVDCLISDISMPAMSGLDLREEVKLKRPDLPFFFITANNAFAERVRVANDAPRVFLKPFNGNELITAVAVAISEYRRSSL